MPRFVIERDDAAEPVAAIDSVAHARTFSMGAKTFDVYIAENRAAFHRFVRLSGIRATHIHG